MFEHLVLWFHLNAGQDADKNHGDFSFLFMRKIVQMDPFIKPYHSIIGL